MVASATARWRPLMDCECSMAGDRMANSYLRDGGGWIFGFGLLTVGVDVLANAATRWRAKTVSVLANAAARWRAKTVSTCFSGKFKFSLRVLDLQQISRVLAYQDIGT